MLTLGSCWQDAESIHHALFKRDNVFIELEVEHPFKVSQNIGPVITEVKPADLDFSEVGFWPETREFVLVARRRDFVTAPKRWKIYYCMEPS